MIVASLCLLLVMACRQMLLLSRHNGKWTLHARSLRMPKTQ